MNYIPKALTRFSGAYKALLAKYDLSNQENEGWMILYETRTGTKPPKPTQSQRQAGERESQRTLQTTS